MKIRLLLIVLLIGTSCTYKSKLKGDVASITEKTYTVSSNAKKSDKAYRTVYTDYGEDNKIVKKNEKYYDELIGYEYDNNGYLKERTKYSNSNGDGIILKKKVYNYNSDGQCSVSKEWTSVNGEKVIGVMEKNSYDSYGNQYQKESFFMTPDGKITPSWIDNNEFDNVGNLIKTTRDNRITEYKYEGDDCIMESYFFTRMKRPYLIKIHEYTYDDTGNWITRLTLSKEYMPSSKEEMEMTMRTIEYK